MSYSRVEKFIVEQLGLPSLADAGAARSRSFVLLLPDHSDAGIRLMARTAVALALRALKGDIWVVPQSVRAVEDELLAGLKEEATLYGQPERLKMGPVPPSETMRLAISMVHAGAVTADASGWSASVNRLLLGGQVAEPPAAAFAVACAFAKLFNAHVLQNRQALEEGWEFCLGEDLLALGSDLDLGTLSLLGAGAIGSAFGFVLKHSGWRARVSVIDYQRYEEPNQETSLLLGLPKVWENPWKARTLASAMATPTLEVFSVEQKLLSADDPLLQIPQDAFVCAVDNAETRRLLDRVNAAVVLNAAVGGSRLDAGHVFWTRHSPLDPLLSSIYRSVDAAARPVARLPREVDDCSRLAYEDASLAAPFMAVAAAALLVAGCAHRALGAQSEQNWLKFDLLGLQARCSSKTLRVRA